MSSIKVYLIEDMLRDTLRGYLSAARKAANRAILNGTSPDAASSFIGDLRVCVETLDAVWRGMRAMAAEHSDCSLSDEFFAAQNEMRFLGWDYLPDLMARDVFWSCTGVVASDFRPGLAGADTDATR